MRSTNSTTSDQHFCGTYQCAAGRPTTVYEKRHPHGIAGSPAKHGRSRSRRPTEKRSGAKKTRANCATTRSIARQAQDGGGTDDKRAQDPGYKYHNGRSAPGRSSLLGPADPMKIHDSMETVNIGPAVAFGRSGLQRHQPVGDKDRGLFEPDTW